MNSYPLVSIIIPNYNHAPFLKERIDSVLNQTYDNFEVIILDDKSTDNSKEVIEVYRSHPRISQIVYNEENSGSTFKQWQKGFSLAKGEYIWIAESDDIAHPDFINAIMERMSDNPSIVLGFSSMIRINEKGENLGRIPLHTRGGETIMGGRRFIKDNMIFGCHILNASSAIFRKDSLNRISQSYLSFKGSGDYQFWIEIALTGKIVKVNKELDYFRNHSNKVTPRSVSSGIQFEEVKRITTFLSKKGLLSQMTRTAVAGFWLNKIRKCKIFNNIGIKKHCWKLWSGDIPNPYLAIIYYYIYGSLRFLRRKL